MLDGVIINADALQVFGNWRVLTARPSSFDETTAPHRLYGHVDGNHAYSTGEWLREVKPLLSEQLPIIVGGTGLNFAALTDGLAEIPPVPADVRCAGDERPLPVLLSELDARTRSRIDTANRARVQRAWEVLRATGRPLADWQDDTGPAALPLHRAQPFLVTADKDWLGKRIAQRFEQMLELGALEEARANLAHWDPAQPSAKAIGAAELIAHLRGEMDLETAQSAATLATRQYAKRQRTWFRSRMKKWRPVAAETLG
ncbi:MAG: tRNA dimethylallyltransferase [Pseudomonadota bacterium]